MKSPVYGRPRNYKHSKGKTHLSAANFNLRGKKFKRVSCGCCYVIDFRDKIIDEIHNKEMKEYSHENDTSLDSII